MTDYLSMRQNAIREASAVELNARLEAVASEFKLEWLESPGENPVQRIWQRKDAFSTNELLLLGDAIANMLAADPAWTRRQIKQIKQGDTGRQAGAIFELLGLNLFCGPNQVVRPAPSGNPGYDGTVYFPDHSSLMVSIKNHGISYAERTFRKAAEDAGTSFVKILERRGINGIELRAFASEHPKSADWKTLRDRTDQIVSGTVDDRSIGIWSGARSPVPAAYLPLSPAHLSYGLLIAAPYHENEPKKFIQSMSEGIANLRKHRSAVGPDVCRTLLLRMSASASLLDCAAWAAEYMRDEPSTPVELLILYQAVPTSDVQLDQRAITHCFVQVLGRGFPNWQAGNAMRRINISTLVGKVTARPIRQVLTDGKVLIALDNHYVYQKGRIFPYYQSRQLPLTATLSGPAPGVLINAVFREGTSLEMITSPDPELVLLP